MTVVGRRREPLDDVVATIWLRKHDTQICETKERVGRRGHDQQPVILRVGVHGDHAVHALEHAARGRKIRVRADLEHQILSMPGPHPDRYVVCAENGLSGKVLEVQRDLQDADGEKGAPA